MAEPQTSPRTDATSAPAASAPPDTGQKSVILSPQDLEALNGLMRPVAAAPAADQPPTFDIPVPEREIAQAASGLNRCTADQFCAEDVVPPASVRLTQPVDVGTMHGTLTVTPGKARVTVPF